jgi:hypothetical protein
MPRHLPPTPIRPPTFDEATEAELAAAAEITPEDITRAQQAWRRDASPEFRDLLDAPEAESA